MYSPPVHGGSNTMNTQQQQQQRQAKPLKLKARKSRLGNPQVKSKPAKSNRPSVRTISVPASQGTVRKVQDPIYTRGAAGDVTVEHSEYLGDVNGSVAFSSVKFPVNPGLPASFPWLANMAPNYESYKCERLEYEFRTTTNNQATGNIALFVDYDPADAAPTDKPAVLNSRSAADGPAWALSIKNSSKREDLNKRSTYLVRNGDVTPASSLTLYDVGNLFVCTKGQANANTIGEIWCHYRIKLMTPQMGVAGVGNALYGKVSGTSLAGALTTAGNGPFTVSGTPAAVTLTATAPYQGLFTIDAVGTTIASSTMTGTGTFTAQGTIIDAAATNLSGTWTLSVITGQTIILTTSAATISQYNFRFGQYLASTD